MNEIIPGLFLGSLPDAKEAPPGYHILCVLEAKPPDEPVNATWIPFLAGDRANVTQLDAIVFVIDACLKKNISVLVHCGEGIERSPLAVAWYLKRRHNMTLDDAYATIRAVRPQVQDRQAWLPMEAKA
jgi:protein-tyrosine phosphatase